MNRRLPCRGLIVGGLTTILCAFSACGVRGERSGSAADTHSILLFSGTGTSPNDVAAVAAILDDYHLEYSEKNSSQLNELGAAQIRRYRLLIVPGGNFVAIGKGLTSATSGKIRKAVEDGLNYLGICAGGFFAGNSPYNGLNLTSGVSFHFYSAENRGIRKAAVAIASAGAPTLDQYWEDGPEFTGWGDVVGKYPDGTAAIVEGTFGSGWVILAGVHPEAPAAWRRGLAFSTSVSADHAYAGKLILAALNRVSLAHY